MICVSSAQLSAAAATIRERKRGPRVIPAEGVTVSAAQLDKAAQILRDAEPSVCNGNVSERPGFIERDQQDDPVVLTLTVGILPSATYRIDRRGTVELEVAA